MKIIFYGTREYDHYYFDVLAADPEYGCEIRFLTANLDADTAPLAQGGDAVCAFVNADCSAPVLEKLAQAGIRSLLLRAAGPTVIIRAASGAGALFARLRGGCAGALSSSCCLAACGIIGIFFRLCHSDLQNNYSAGRPRLWEQPRCAWEAP